MEMHISSFILPILLMAAASGSRLTPREVDDQVDVRKWKILRQAGTSNEHDIHNRVFCLCPNCHQRPLMHRFVTTVSRTVRRHGTNSMPLPEVLQIFGQRRSVTADEYLIIYQKFLEGNATEAGLETEDGAAERV